MLTLLRPLCLVLALVIVKAQKELEDTNGSIDMRMEIGPSLGLHAKAGAIQVQCTFDGSKTDLKWPYRMRIKRSSSLGESADELMAAVVQSKVVNGLENSEIEATGTLTSTGDVVQADLKVRYLEDDVGFCRIYTCIVDGWLSWDRPVEELTFVSKSITVDPPEGVPCVPDNLMNKARIDDIVGKVDQCSALSEDVQKNAKALEALTESAKLIPEVSETLRSNGEVFGALNEKVDNLSDITGTNTQNIETLETKVDDSFDTIREKVQDCENIVKSPDQTLVEPLQRLIEVMSINKADYDVSSFYNFHVYIASKANPTFDLHEMNELCKTQNGYLVEFDNQDEQKFVGDFVGTLSTGVFATGGNDVAVEGDYVYYNSGKPMTNILWIKNEPNNAFGNEDCIQITPTGLNDIRCSLPRRYVCEIPVL